MDWKIRLQGLHTYPTFSAALAEFELFLRQAGLLPASKEFQGIFI